MKLTLRDLFWLILVAAVSCGWLAQYVNTQRRLAAENEKYKATIRALMFEVMSHGGYSTGTDEFGRINVIYKSSNKIEIPY